MAKWIYNRPYEFCSPAELDVARVLAKLGDGWTIRWGFYYDTDREGDFLVLGPTGGVLVLEVKGGQLRKLDTTGRWEGSEQDHPLMQLSAEWKAVIERMQSFANGRQVPFVKKALCVPEITIEQNATEFRGMERSLFVDRRDLADFVTTWHERLFEKNLPVPPDSRKVFTDAFASDISPKALKHFVSETDRVLLRHLQGDYEILEMLDGNRQLFVEGGPGTGKTWLALEQAYRLAESGNGQRVLLLCYNLALANLLSELVAKRKPKRGEVVVRSWEGLSRELFAAVGVGWNEPEAYADRYRYYTEEVPGLVEEIVGDPQFKPAFDALVVDEAQDHDTTLNGTTRGVGWWDSYFRLLKNGTDAPMAIFYDPEQRPIFRQPHFFDSAALRVRLPRSAHLRVWYARRYARPIFDYLKTLRSPTTDRIVESMRAKSSLPEGPGVEIHQVAAGQMKTRLHDVIARWVADGLCRLDQILILAPHQQAKTSLAGCDKLGEWPLLEGFQRSPGGMNLLSVRRAKGLDSLGIILVDFPHFDEIAEGQDKMDFFMGASRARQLLAVLHLGSVRSSPSQRTTDPNNDRSRT